MEELDLLRRKSADLARQGHYQEAIKTIITVLNRCNADGGHQDAGDHLRLAGYLFLTKAIPGAINALRDALAQFPDDYRIHGNLATLLMRQGDYDEALVLLEQVLAGDAESPNTLDCLAHCHGKKGDLEKAREFGEKSLLLKDASVGNPMAEVPTAPPEAFDPTSPGSNIISFSLWGDDERYLLGALQNARLCPDIYPGWRCRFYLDDTVPADFVENLKGLGSEIIKARRNGPFDGLFWRFAVASDPKVKRFLVRDADSIINVRERVAVDEWLASDKYFHVMRDFFTHSEVILAGMWGGVGGVLPPLQDMLARYRTDLLPTAHVDQWFLREMVWPIIRQSCLVHDSLFRCFDAQDFPAVGRLLPGRHVGQNAHVLRKKPVADGAVKE